VIDKEDNKVNAAYSAWPDRLYVVGKDGKVAYKGGPGPGGFKPAELEAWLKKNAGK
jgi:type I thyroxine 5'-deiodinase